MKWDHVYSQFDNLIWVIVAVGVLVTAKVFDIPALNAIAGACLVKIKSENGPQNQEPEKNPLTKPE